MKGARVLVVDDHRGMLRAVRRILEGSCEVTAFTSPLEALNVAASINPELAIVDIRMPEMDGFALLRRLKGALPDLDVILMTGSVTDLDQKMIHAIREQAFYFIQKPFDAELLRTLVERQGFEVTATFGDWMVPGFFYRAFRYTLRPFGVVLPLHPRGLMGLDRLGHNWRQWFRKTSLAPWTFAMIGVVGKKR